MEHLAQDSNQILFSNGVGIAQSGNTWTTDESRPDSLVTNCIKRCLGQMLIVRPLELNAEIKTSTGFSLLVAETAKDDAEKLLSIGRVIAVGEEAGKRQGVSKLVEGDYVLFPKFHGDRLFINGVRVIAMYDDVPVLVVDKDKIDLTPHK
jgi:co-chaperonin GroES (HSP10)